MTAALTQEQRTILEQRGVLSPQEVHRLASKTKRVMDGDAGAKAACHSDSVDGDEAKQIQAQKLVKLNTAPAHNIPSHDPVI